MYHGQVSKEIAKGLLSLKKRIDSANIPSSKVDETLNIATWNIREFGKKRRKEASIHYIAEILGQFDLIGLVELRDNLEDLKRVLEILGPYWRTVYSDMILDAGGNRERIAYIYDKRTVTFNGLAAEANEPRKKKGVEYLAEESFWRAPYMASFKSGNFDFVVLTAHIRWGDNEAGREDELGMLANWIEAKRIEKNNEDKDLIVMGDFNIPSLKSPLYAAITRHGLMMPKALAGVQGSNLEKNKRYDQILHHPQYPELFVKAGGVLDFFIDEASIPELFPEKLSKADFTYQMSDHLPLWMQIRTDLDGFELDQIIQ